MSFFISLGYFFVTLNYHLNVHDLCHIHVRIYLTPSHLNPYHNHSKNNTSILIPHLFHGGVIKIPNLCVSKSPFCIDSVRACVLICRAFDLDIIRRPSVRAHVLVRGKSHYAQMFSMHFEKNYLFFSLLE